MAFNFVALVLKSSLCWYGMAAAFMRVFARWRNSSNLRRSARSEESIGRGMGHFWGGLGGPDSTIKAVGAIAGLVRYKCGVSTEGISQPWFKTG